MVLITIDLLVQRTLRVGSGEEEIPVVQTGYPTNDSKNPSGCPKYASGKRSFPCHVRDSPHCNGKCRNVTSGFLEGSHWTPSGDHPMEFQENLLE